MATITSRRRLEAARLTFSGRTLSPLQRDAFVFLWTLLIATGIAIYIYYTLDLWNGDSLSRTVDAYLVLFGRDPHLAAIGFSWPPIPTFTRVLLLPITRPLGLTEFTGQISSVIFTAATVAMLNHLLRDQLVSAMTRLLWILATFLNPVVIFHFTNGTAESLFLFLVLGVLFFERKLGSQPFPAVLWIGLFAGIALWVRYEALAVALTAALGLIMFAILDKNFVNRRDAVDRLEAFLITILAPSAFLGMLWMFLNWSIQGDPLFFYTGLYSIKGAVDVAGSNPDHPLAYAVGSIPGTLWYIGQRLLQLSFLMPIVAAIVMVRGVLRRDMVGPALVFICFSTVGLQAFQAFSGGIPPWLRYWVYLPIFTLVLLGHLNQEIPSFRRPRPEARVLRLVVLPLLMLLGSYISWQAMHREEVGVDEQIFVRELEGNHEQTLPLRAFYPDRELMAEIAEYLRPYPGTVMLSVERGSAFVVSIDDPKRLVVDSDVDYLEMVREPIGRVGWVLVPNPGTQTSRQLLRDPIFTTYPGIYEGASWLTLEKEFAGAPPWRLFRVNPVPEVPAAPAPPPRS